MERGTMSRKWILVITTASAVSLLAACAQIPQATPAAKKVTASTNWPAKNCKVLKKVNFVMDNMNLSAAELEQGAMNGAKNQTAKMGGNYLHVRKNYATFIRSGLGPHAASKVTISGYAYRCPA
jgi:hypothetical protein